MRRPLSSIHSVRHKGIGFIADGDCDDAEFRRRRRRDAECVMTAGSPRRDRQSRRVASDGCVKPVSVRPVGEVKFFLFSGGDEQGLDRLRAVAAPQLAAIGGGRDHRRDRDNRKRDHEFDQGETGGGVSLRHEVLTGSPA